MKMNYYVHKNSIANSDALKYERHFKSRFLNRIQRYGLDGIIQQNKIKF